MTNSASAPMQRPSRKRATRVALNTFMVGLIVFGAFTLVHRYQRACTRAEASFRPVAGSVDAYVSRASRRAP